MPAREMLEGLLQGYMSKDLAKIMSYVAEDSVFHDPHYPQPRMTGREEIQQGVEWALSSLEKPGFKIRQIWHDGDSGAAEVDTHHVIRAGMETKFDQVLIFEIRDGKFTRLQSYVPYAPHGIAGMISKATRLVWQLQGKLK